MEQSPLFIFNFYCGFRSRQEIGQIEAEDWALVGAKQGLIRTTSLQAALSVTFVDPEK